MTFSRFGLLRFPRRLFIHARSERGASRGGDRIGRVAREWRQIARNTHKAERADRRWVRHAADLRDRVMGSARGRRGSRRDVDGELVTEGWTYDAENQAVVFDEEPEGGVIIELRYFISPDCE